MTITNFKIATKINIAFVALIAAFMISAGVTYGAIQAMGAASLESSANMRLSGDANVLLTEVLEQTNALRGFVIKGDPKFAATYKESKASFDRTLSAMAQTARSPEQQTHLKAMRAAMAKWRLAVGDKVVGLMATPGGQAEAAALSGVKSLTLLRQVQGQIRATAQAAAAKSEADHARATRTGSMALILGSLLSLVIAALMGLLLSMTVGRPVAQMTALMRRLAEGETQIDIPASVRTDEIGDMAKAILSFKDAAIRKAQLEAEAAAARRAAEAERDRSEAAARAAAEELAEIVGSLAAALSQLAAGDLSYRLSEQFPPQYEVLKDDFNKAVAALNDMVAVISGNAEMITEGVGEIATASQDLSRRTEHQAATLERTAAALDQVTATVKRSAEGAIQVSTTAASAKIEAQRSGVVMRDALAAMSEIEHSSGQIVQIIGVIDEIAFQTNLLALNAGVEAARAGDGGRGFAVVAQEVRALAQRSADAAREIKSLIASSSDQVQRGVRLVGDTGVALDGIAAKVTEMDALIAEIAQSSQEQARGLNQVNTAVNQMDQVTQQNAAMVEETTAAVANLRGEAVELARLVAAFETGDGRAPGAGRMLARSGRRTEAANPVRPPQGMLAAMAGGA